MTGNMTGPWNTTWSDFYLACFAVGFLLSAVSFIAGGLRWHAHLPHLPHAGGHVGGGHAGAGHAPVPHPARATARLRKPVAQRRCRRSTSLP